MKVEDIKVGMTLYDLIEGNLEKRGIKKEEGLMENPTVKEIIRKFAKHLNSLGFVQVR